MPSLLIRGLDDDLKRRLRVRAAENGHSMEEEVRQILRQTLGAPALQEAAASPPSQEDAPPAAQAGASVRPPQPVQGPGRVRLFRR